MFTRFILTISLPREKISIIKMLRAIAGPNHPLGKIKDCKDAVEDQVCFDSYMDNYVSLKIEVDEAALGRAAFYQLYFNMDSGIVEIVGIDIRPRSDFNLTTADRDLPF